MKKLVSIILAVLMTTSVMMFGCNGDNNTKATVELENGKTYSDQIGEVNASTGLEEIISYNKDIFYRNDVKYTCADPFAFQCLDETDTENYGKYFVIGTTGVGTFNMYASDDLTSWEPYAGVYTYSKNSWEYNNCWAPEIVWDKNAKPTDYGLEESDKSTGVYFFFYSSTAYDAWKQADYDIGLGVSTCPYGPYVAWEGVETGATIAGVNYAEAINFARYTNYAEDAEVQSAEALAEAIANTASSTLPTTESGKYIIRNTNAVTVSDPWLNTAALRASLKFQWEHSRNNPANAANPDNTVVGREYDGTVLNYYADLMQVDESVDYINCNIDMSPFIDPATGDYYLFWSFIPNRNRTIADPLDSTGITKLFQGQNTYALKFLNNNWTQPDYSTVTRITRTHYNMVNAQAAEIYNEQAAAFDATQYENGYQETEMAVFGLADGENREGPLDGSQGHVNEGPCVFYNEKTGLYYLMISVAGYTSSNYSLVQAVAYSPMGPYRKLDLDEGGVMLTADGGRTTDVVSGPGHHSILKCGDEYINVYHKHKNHDVSIHDRGANADRLLFIPNNDGMYVMYTNGPTTSIQPKFYGTGTTKYDIISGEATVTTSDAGNETVKYLNDGILSMHDDEVAPFVHEYETTENEVTITVSFEDYRTITAVMIYNSKNIETAFYDVKRIEMDAKIDGTEFTAVIKNLDFYWALYSSQDSFMRSGGAAVAAFSEMSIKTIRITIERDIVRPNNEGLGISEIYVLGVPQNA